ncbi:hypothetical protein E2K93_12435 [Thalassotalea sp. HSM 43]|uniref:hypothetical protein n=1 Tax=Thalassotalea sp. HSM 43 TaxID=2552945 RepID=UPI0010811804|nr:hypothetical protein [Thalassotalea sp. HSM 43]QBY05140.1 hypothetical protein E2K93_12435 [Thalassotalea sp. HSM 43]
MSQIKPQLQLPVSWDELPYPSGTPYDRFIDNLGDYGISAADGDLLAVAQRSGYVDYRDYLPIYFHNGTSYEFEGLLDYSAEGYDGSPSHIDISGNYIAVSMHTATESTYEDGVVLVYRRVSAANYMLEAKLHNRHPAGTTYPYHFGDLVVIIGDSLFITYDPYNNDTDQLIYHYERDGAGVWNRANDLTVSNIHGNDGFATKLMKSPKGELLFTADVDGSTADTLFVFANDGAGTWSQKQKIDINFSSVSQCIFDDATDSFVILSSDDLEEWSFNGAEYELTRVNSNALDPYSVTSSNTQWHSAYHNGYIFVRTTVATTDTANSILVLGRNLDTGDFEAVGEIYNPRGYVSPTQFGYLLSTPHELLAFDAYDDTYSTSQTGLIRSLKPDAGGAFANLTYKVNDVTYAIPTDIQTYQSGALIPAQKAFVKDANGTYINIWERS